jgi:hypothetical protein
MGLRELFGGGKAEPALGTAKRATVLQIEGGQVIGSDHPSYVDVAGDCATAHFLTAKLDASRAAEDADTKA